VSQAASGRSRYLWVTIARQARTDGAHLFFLRTNENKRLFPHRISNRRCGGSAHFPVAIEEIHALGIIMQFLNDVSLWSPIGNFSITRTCSTKTRPFVTLIFCKVKLKSLVTLAHPPGCIEQAWTEWIPACKGTGVSSLRQLVGWTNSRVVVSRRTITTAARATLRSGAA